MATSFMLAQHTHNLLFNKQFAPYSQLRVFNLIREIRLTETYADCS